MRSDQWQHIFFRALLSFLSGPMHAGRCGDTEQQLFHEPLENV